LCPLLACRSNFKADESWTRSRKKIPRSVLVLDREEVPIVEE
jgi:hypothetical protein